MTISKVHIRLIFHNTEELRETPGGKYQILKRELERIRSSPLEHYFILEKGETFESKLLEGYPQKSPLNFHDWLNQICSDREEHSIYITRVFRDLHFVQKWHESVRSTHLMEQPENMLMELALLFLARRKSILHIAAHGGLNDNIVRYIPVTGPMYEFTSDDFVSIIRRAKECAIDRPISEVFQKFRNPLYDLFVHLDICSSGLSLAPAYSLGRTNPNIRSLNSLAEEFSAGLVTAGIPGTVFGFVYLLGFNLVANQLHIARLPIQIDIVNFCAAVLRNRKEYPLDIILQVKKLFDNVSTSFDTVPVAKIKVVRDRSGRYEKTEYIKNNDSSVSSVIQEYSANLRAKILLTPPWNTAAKRVFDEVIAFQNAHTPREEYKNLLVNKLVSLMSDLKKILDPNSSIREDNYLSFLQSLELIKDL